VSHTETSGVVSLEFFRSYCSLVVDWETSNSRQNTPPRLLLPDDQISVEQISYASRYTRSRKQRSFCATSEVGISVVHGIEKNKQQRNGR
jgi:hypothetical protein